MSLVNIRNMLPNLQQWHFFTKMRSIYQCRHLHLSRKTLVMFDCRMPGVLQLKKFDYCVTHTSSLQRCLIHTSKYQYKNKMPHANDSDLNKNNNLTENGTTNYRREVKDNEPIIVFERKENITHTKRPELSEQINNEPSIAKSEFRENEPLKESKDPEEIEKIEVNVDLVKTNENMEVAKNNKVEYKLQPQDANFELEEIDESKGPVQHVIFSMLENEEKNLETFTKAVDIFIVKAGNHQRGAVDFISSAMGEMQSYGVVRKIDAYKKLISIYPPGSKVGETFLEVEFMYQSTHQHTCNVLLDYGERHGVRADTDLLDLVTAVFGKNSHVARKLYRQLYWQPKFVNSDPFTPTAKQFTLAGYYQPEETLLRKMCPDLETELYAVQAKDFEHYEDDTYVVYAQSPAQRELLGQLPVDKPIIVDGGYPTWLRECCFTYFILRSEVTEKSKSYDKYDAMFEGGEPEEEDDIPYDLYYSVLPDRVIKQREEKRKKILERSPTVHEQDDGTIIAIAITGTASKDSLKTWIKGLERINPTLSQIPVVFMLRTPESGVTLWDADEVHKTKGEFPSHPFVDLEQ